MSMSRLTDTHRNEAWHCTAHAELASFIVGCWDHAHASNLQVHADSPPCVMRPRLRRRTRGHSYLPRWVCQQAKGYPASQLQQRTCPYPPKRGTQHTWKLSSAIYLCGDDKSNIYEFIQPMGLIRIARSFPDRFQFHSDLHTSFYHTASQQCQAKRTTIQIQSSRRSCSIWLMESVRVCDPQCEFEFATTPLESEEMIYGEYNDSARCAEW